MNFHLDENVSIAVAFGLRRRGFDITTSADVGLLGGTDEQQLAHCQISGRITVTHDADMLRLAAKGIHHAGIAYCPNQKYKTGELILRILALAGRVSGEDMRDRIEFL